MITQELKVYIRQQLEAGVARDVIKKTLSVGGWGEEDLNDAFFAIESPQSPLAVTPSPNAQMPIQSPIQPTSSRGHKEIWAIVIVLLLIIGAGGAFAGNHYGLFVLPMVTTAASSTPFANTNGAKTASTPTNSASSTDQESSNTGPSTTTSSSTNVASSIPSAKLTINNATSVVASASNNFTLKWSSTNADKFSTTQSLSSCFIPAMNKTDTVTNNISSADGTDSSLAFTTDELALLAGCDMNITYIAKNTKTGKEAHAVVDILFPSNDGTTKQLINMTSPQTQPTKGN